MLTIRTIQKNDQILLTSAPGVCENNFLFFGVTGVLNSFRGLNLAGGFSTASNFELLEVELLVEVSLLSSSLFLDDALELLNLLPGRVDFETFEPLFGLRRLLSSASATDEASKSVVMLDTVLSSNETCVVAVFMSS